MKNKLKLNIQLASITNDSPYSDRKNCLFFIHDFSMNDNSFCIPEELCSAINPKTSKPNYDSLNGAPIVTATTMDGSDLKGHEPEYNKSGDIIGLNTDAIGSLYNAHIGTHQINGEDKYGLWAEGYLWLRFENTLNVVENIFNENGSVDTSVEIQVGGFEFSEEGRTATNSILYMGHCLLGTTVEPAYPDSGMYEMNLLVAEAYKKDLSVLNQESDAPVDNIKTSSKGGSVKEVAKEDVVFNFGKEILNKIETSEMSFEDIRGQLWSQLNSEKDAEGYTIYKYWIMEVYNGYAIINEESTGKNYKISYSTGETEISVDMGSMVEVVNQWVEVQVNPNPEDNTNLSTENEELKSQMYEKDKEIDELKTKVASLEGEVKTKEEAMELNQTEANEKIIKLGTVVEGLQEELNSFKPIKEEYDRIQEELKQKELATKRAELKQYIINSKVYSEKDFEDNEDLKTIVSEVDWVKAKEIIADYFVKKTVGTDVSKIETSEVIIPVDDKGKSLFYSVKDEMYAPLEK